MMHILVGRSANRNLGARLGFGCSILLLALAILSVWSPAPAVAQPLAAALAQPTVTAGYMHSQAIKADGSLWLWGFDLTDELGGLITGPHAPTRFGMDNDWKAVSAGLMSWLGLKEDGSLWTMGDNPASSLIVGNVVETSAPARLGVANDWTAVSVGMFDGLALKADGSLWTMEVLDEDDLLPTPTRLDADGNWAAVSAGFTHSLLLKTDGSLWIIEYAVEFAPDGESVTSFERAVTQIGTDKDWAAVSAGGAHSLAMKTDGSLWAWGYNEYGQLGIGTSSDQSFPTRVGTDKDWTAISAGGGHSMGLKSDGTLWAWGYNDYGQLGDDTDTNRSVPTRVGTSNNWVEVTAGLGHTLALREDGALWAWGDNSYGQIGDGTTEERRTPVKVLTDVRVPPRSGGGVEVSFSDVAGSPYETAIYELAGRGIITGFDDGTFRAGDPVTRQQFAKMIVKAMGLTVTGSEVCPFADVIPQTAPDPLYPTKYVAVCALRGITQGKTATSFDPYNSITHEQLITMVSRAAALSDPPATYAASFVSTQFSLEEHHRNARKAAYAGILDGLQGLGTSYDFRAPSTRGECAQLLFNLLNMLED